MKKNLFFLAAAALALASCSSDETTATNQSLQDANEISFRAFNNNVIRSATDITVSNLPSFNVTAFKTGTNSSAYIDDVVFTGAGTPKTYHSANKYYWPSYNLDFYAYYWDTSLSGVSKTDYRTFVVTPTVSAETAGNQIDLIYAALKNKGKSDGATGLPINFSHAGSKIELKVSHAGGVNNQIYCEVKAWGVGYLDNSGTFTFPDYSGNSTASTTSGTLPETYWSGNTDQATDKQIYRSTDLATAVKVGPAVNTPTGAVTSYTFEEKMILVPQGNSTAIPVATKYQSATANSKPEGTYVAVKMAIKTISSETIQDEVWAMWPAPVSWEPGKKYTYNVTIDNGGYFEENADDDDDLDPILEGAEIYFANVTVSDWTNASETNVTIPAANLVYGTNYTYNNENLASGTETMTFNIGGLDGNKYIKVTKGGTDGEAQVASSTPTLNTVTSESGATQVVTVTLNANAGAAKAMTITIQEYDDLEGNTASGTPTVITINQKAS